MARYILYLARKGGFVGKKISRAYILAMWAVCLIALWFIPNFVRYSLGIPYQLSDYGVVIYTRYFAVVLLVSGLYEFRWRMPRTLQLGSFIKRVALIAMSSGLVAGEMIVSHFPKPTIWEWIVMPFVVAIVGGVQMAMAGTLMTAAYLESTKEK